MAAGSPVQPALALTVSAEARAFLTPLLNAAAAPEMTAALLRNPITRKAVRLAAATHLKPLEKARAARFGVAVTRGKLAGVPVKFVRRRDIDAADPRVLLNFHGGGFMIDAGSLTETIPIAGLTGIPVVTVLYRMAPEHRFPAAVDDALAVYRETLEKRRPGAVGIYGSSAGAVLTLQLLARIKAEGLPMPGAAGVFSGAGDVTATGDCEAYLPPMMGSRTAAQTMAEYIGTHDPADPLLSPTCGDLTGFPPVMAMTSTRDQLLSHTLLADLALRQAGVAVDLRVYEGMPHAFWAWIDCPETDIALAAQADFFARRLSS